LSRYLFNRKIDVYIKECETIKETLKKKGFLKREDSRVNLLSAEDKDTEIIKKSCIFKGHNSDGSLKPLRRFYIEDGEVKEAKEILKQDILVVDLYENSIYLYNSTNDEKCVHGYIIKEKKGMNEEKTLIFTKDRVKIFHKNINALLKFSDIENFIDRVVL
jgi:hypothetical protein